MLELDLALKYWKYILLGASVLLNFGLAFGWHSSHNALVTERAAHVQDTTNFKNAQATADALAKAKQSALTKEGQDAATKADQSYSALLAQYHTSILRYGTNQSNPSPSGNSELQPAQSGNGPSASTDLPETITISGADAQICATNTARLSAVHDWAITLENTK